MNGIYKKKGGGKRQGMAPLFSIGRRKSYAFEDGKKGAKEGKEQRKKENKKKKSVPKEEIEKNRAANRKPLAL